MIVLPFGHATSRRLSAICPPRARPTHSFATGTMRSPMNSVAVSPVAEVGGKTKPYDTPWVVSCSPWKGIPLSTYDVLDCANTMLGISDCVVPYKNTKHTCASQRGQSQKAPEDCHRVRTTCLAFFAAVYIRLFERSGQYAKLTMFRSQVDIPCRTLKRLLF